MPCLCGPTKELFLSSETSLFIVENLHKLSRFYSYRSRGQVEMYHKKYPDHIVLFQTNSTPAWRNASSVRSFFIFWKVSLIVNALLLFGQRHSYFHIASHFTQYLDFILSFQLRFNPLNFGYFDRFLSWQIH